MDEENNGIGWEGEEDQALWQLLARARPIETSPYFARRVLRDLDTGAARADEVAGGWRAWWRPGWILAGSAAIVCAGVFGAFSFLAPPAARPRLVVNRPAVAPVMVVVDRQPVSPAPAVPAAAPASGDAVVLAADDVSPQDVDVIADLDNLVAREETNEWTDDTSRF